MIEVHTLQALFCSPNGREIKVSNIWSELFPTRTLGIVNNNHMLTASFCFCASFSFLTPGTTQVGWKGKSIFFEVINNLFDPSKPSFLALGSAP